MRLLLVNTVAFTANGITSVIMNDLRHIGRAGLQTDVVAMGEIAPNFREELEALGIRVVVLARLKQPLHYLRALYELMRKNRYDVVHIHGNSGTMLMELLPAWLCGVPVRIVHAHSTQCNRLWMHKLLRPFCNALRTHGFACGEAAGKFMFGSGKYTLRRNGIDLERYAFDARVREAIRGGETHRIVAHVGVFNDNKNQCFLIDLLARKLDICLWLIGDGPMLNEMKAYATETGVGHRVRFVGAVNNVTDYLQAADVFALPSHWEGFPMTLLEAQAAGLPCLISDSISSETELTADVHRLSLAEFGPWCDEIDRLPERDRDRASAQNIAALRQAGCDAQTSAAALKRFYLEWLKEKHRK